MNAGSQACVFTKAVLVLITEPSLTFLICKVRLRIRYDKDAYNSSICEVEGGGAEALVILAYRVSLRPTWGT